MWVGMIIVLLGLLLVGLADILFGNHSDDTTNTNGIIAGKYKQSVMLKTTFYTDMVLTLYSMYTVLVTDLVLQTSHLLSVLFVQ
jgi:hypothetical protein